MENYLLILQDSLLKKLRVLERLEDCNLRQEVALKKKPVSLEEFDAITDEKGTLIAQMLKLDNGFEQLYERVKAQLEQDKEAYRMEVASLQDLVRQITDKSMTLQAQETRNKALVESFFSKEKASLRKGRLGSQAAMSYYANMSRMGVNDPRVIDEKN